MSPAIFVKVNVHGGVQDWIRVDHISEVLAQRKNSVPFDECGSLLFLTTGREVSVVETPDEVMALIEKVMVTCSEYGYFSSEDAE